MLPGAAVNPWPFDLRTSQTASACAMVLTGFSSSRSCSAGAGLSKKQIAMIKQLAQAGTLHSVLAAATQQVAPDGPKSGGKGKKGQDTQSVAASPAPLVQDGWKTVANKQKKKENEENKDQKHGDVLQSDDWGVPVLKDVTEVTAQATGVCLVSALDAKTLKTNLRASQKLAILSPIRVDGEGAEIHVLVKDKDDRLQVRRRFLIQLGDGEVTFGCSSPKREVVRDTEKVVLTLSRQHTGEAAWMAATKTPKEAARKWMTARPNTEILDMFPPTRIAGDSDQLQVIAVAPKSSTLAVLKQSGVDGVFSRAFYDGTENPFSKENYNVVMLPKETPLTDATKKAELMGEDALGVVVTRKGLAIRVPREKFEQAAKSIRPADYEMMLGKIWEVSGLPTWMGKTALAEFLGSWKCAPIRTFTTGQQKWSRTWIVRSQDEPMTKILQHVEGIAVIKEAQRLPGPKREVEKWSPPAARQHVEFPAKWAALVKRQETDDPQSAKRTTPVAAAASPAAKAEEDLGLKGTLAALTQMVTALQREVAALRGDDLESSPEVSKARAASA